jgi:hypothetical protein
VTVVEDVSFSDGICILVQQAERERQRGIEEENEGEREGEGDGGRKGERKI